MKTIAKILVICLGFALWSCSEKDLTTSIALRSIDDYLQYKPLYESTNIQLGKTKLRASKDSELIAIYKKLEEEGYLEFEGDEMRKRWLSKDSIWNTTLKVTDKAAPYVIEQKNSKVTVKTLEYVVNSDKPLEIHNKNKKSASITVMLFKNPTPFAPLGKDNNPNTNFITKKFKLRFNEKYGWEVVN